MKLKQLESILQQVEGFEDPKVNLEQYQTSPHLASQVLFSQKDRIEGRNLLDLGCGSGTLAIGSLLLGADFVLGVDIDPEALSTCTRNVEQLLEESDSRFDLIQGNVVQEHLFARFEKAFDVVLMNPPFGTKRNKGMDMVFLKRALDMATESVFSLHKTSTRDHISRKAKDWGVEMKVEAELRFDLPSSYAFHTKRSVDIEVDFIRFSFD